MRKKLNLKRICKFLLQNKVVAIPTETVYGLAANSYSEEAIKKIFQIKERPLYNPLIVHTNSIIRVFDFVDNFPAPLYNLAKIFWPGPLTILLEKKNIIPNLVTANSKYVGVRIPNKKITLRLLSKLSFPLAAPSANPFKYISPTTASHVKKNLGTKISAILNGGDCEIGLESTIISLKNQEIIVHRLGGVTIEMLQESTNLNVKLQDKSDDIILPGSLKKHYSPKSKVIICQNLDKKINDYQGKSFAVLSFKKYYPIDKIKVLSSIGSLHEASKNLYSSLHELDNLGVDFILTEFLPEEGLGITINDRLKRAAYSEIL